jgi:hypothetical protein
MPIPPETLTTGQTSGTTDSTHFLLMFSGLFYTQELVSVEQEVVSIGLRICPFRAPTVIFLYLYLYLSFISFHVALPPLFSLFRC